VFSSCLVPSTSRSHLVNVAMPCLVASDLVSVLFPVPAASCPVPVPHGSVSAVSARRVGSRLVLSPRLSRSIRGRVLSCRVLSAASHLSLASRPRNHVSPTACLVEIVVLCLVLSPSPCAILSLSYSSTSLSPDLLAQCFSGSVSVLSPNS
jgi:hypothetical protein